MNTIEKLTEVLQTIGTVLPVLDHDSDARIVEADGERCIVRLKYSTRHYGGPITERGIRVGYDSTFPLKKDGTYSWDKIEAAVRAQLASNKRQRERDAQYAAERIARQDKAAENLKLFAMRANLPAKHEWEPDRVRTLGRATFTTGADGVSVDIRDLPVAEAAALVDYLRTRQLFITKG